MTNPVSPTSTTTATNGGRPGTVEAAFWLFLVTPIIGLILGLVNLGGGISAANQVAARAGVGGGAVIAGIVIGLVIDIVLLAAFIVVDVFFRRGANWARIVLTVLGALSVFGIIGLGAITFVLYVVAIILSWLPASSAWFRSVRGTAAPRTV
ncbi:MAG TPA: hypothetical protein VGC94_08140 [Amnibacterium sp.]|jgi:hypothetical protein